jgi:glyoxylase-like metal-dependent hydrolase (beta-lactamase superfamily II)
VETIAAGVHQVSKGVNAFIVDGDEGVTLVDTGFFKRGSVIVAGLQTLGRSVADVAAVVLTHAHIDHVGGAAALQRASGATVMASAADAPAIRPEVPKPPAPLLDRFASLRPLARLFPQGKPVEVDAVVGEHEEAPLPADLTVIDTPGHTPGHVSYLLDRHGGVLFVGDAAVSGRGGRIKRGYMNRATPAFDASLRRLAELDFEIACFGHSAPLRSGAAGAFRRFVAAL